MYIFIYVLKHDFVMISYKRKKKGNEIYMHDTNHHTHTNKQYAKEKVILMLPLIPKRIAWNIIPKRIAWNIISKRIAWNIISKRIAC